MSTDPTASERTDDASRHDEGDRRAGYRAAILAAAESAFAERGYDATKVQDLAREAGVSLTTLYGVFPGKWEIFCAVQELRLGELLRTVLEAGPIPSDPLARLCFGIERYLRFHMDHPNFLRLELREGVPWGTTDELRTPPQTRAWKTGLAMMTQAFRDGMASGLFEEDDPEICARTTTAMSQVRLALWHRAGGVPEPDVVVHRTLGQLVRTFVRGDQVGAKLAWLAERLGM